MVHVTKTGNFFYFYVQALNPPAFLKFLLQDYFCVPHVCSEAESNQARGTHRVSFCLGTTMALGVWNSWASGAVGPPAVSLASRAKTSIFQNKAASLKGLGPGKKKGCPRSSGAREEEAAGRSKSLSRQVIAGEGNKPA